MGIRPSGRHWEGSRMISWDIEVETDPLANVKGVPEERHEFADIVAHIDSGQVLGLIVELFVHQGDGINTRADLFEYAGDDLVLELI
jgi:hypothetical protein